MHSPRCSTYWKNGSGDWVMRRLKDWLKTYLEFKQFMEAPESFHFWTGVGTIAAALRRKVYVKELGYQWSPNFYLIFVSDPGICTKSTTIDQGRRMLENINGIHIGPDAITWQSLVNEMANAGVDFLMPDSTYMRSSCMTFFSAELGSLINFEDRQMIIVLTDLWDGKVGSWKKSTRHSGKDEVHNPWINILACVTPDWLSDNMPRVMIGGGFTSRSVFIYANQKRQLVAYPSRLAATQGYNEGRLKKMEEDLLHDLELIADMRGEFTITEEAYKWGEAWYYVNYDRMVHSSRKDIRGYLNRKQAHMHKLAMVVSASYKDSLVIEQSDMARAEAILTATESDMGTVYRMIQTTEPMERVSRIVSIISSSGQIQKAELYRQHFIHEMSWVEFEDALRSAIEAKLVDEARFGSIAVLLPHRSSDTQSNLGYTSSEEEVQ